MDEQLSLIIQSADAMSTAFMVFVVTIIIWVSCETILIFRDKRESLKASDKSSVLLLVLMMEAMLIANVFSGFQVACLPGDSDMHFRIGTAIMWGGMSLRFWAVYTLGNFFTTVIGIQQNHRIITDGPYKYIRHPSYAGALLILLGIGIAFGNIIGFVLGMMLVITGYCYRISVEERILVSSLGFAYSDYAKTTKRLIPFIY